eukprot:5034459-Alexandrium_andersonii.AAC.1
MLPAEPRRNTPASSSARPSGATASCPRGLLSPPRNNASRAEVERALECRSAALHGPGTARRIARNIVRA